MANYHRIIELRPEMGEFFANRRNIAFRGDVLTYGTDIRCDSFSTDAAGFRHSMLDGRTLSLADCVRSGRYGLVLGASNVFGFGIPGNENTLASLLGARFGFPFANAAMPGANSRNLHSLLIGVIAAGREPPAVVVHSTSGELGNFCESSLGDPVFGSPNRAQLKAIAESGARGDPDGSFPRVLAFTALWTSAIAKLCREKRVPLVLTHQSTFFEKAAPTALELECGLGTPFNASQEGQFANHRKFDEPFFANRKMLADRFGVPLAGWGKTGDMTFIDEFHCDSEGTRLMSQVVGEEIEPLLRSEPRGLRASES